ncbi:GDSL-type esterase/lipase family protein [Paenibacillus motobuensis]|uniref:GDSL-type esterase/lipase family protein n=1 Tax=Paenibacillus TaxID=44249 RepID=UPI00203D2BDC|nr:MULTISPECIES: GDSL-type esterase/lipase family protein [Paenibacillus]MCM3040050.1 GDSL-type esterase/lipase family protein [Paenibacillus lutimineralis]MCM3647154.1 GDSL-type esterase/lipase family protein [Paenibacillus motobuensis]
MNKSSRIWLVTGLLSAVSTLLLIVGFIYAVYDMTVPASEASKAKPDSGVQMSVTAAPFDITAIGDSLAKGTGDDTGNGFARRTVQLLTKQGKSSKLVNNLGINGLTTKALLPTLDEPGVQYGLKQAGIIILSIGGNDLFAGAQSYQSSGELPTEAEMNAAVKTSGENFKKIVSKLKQINPDAQLVYVGLYNPFADLKDVKEAGDQAVANWNLNVLDTMNQYSGTIVIPTYDLFTSNLDRYLSGDHFHPNGDGYQRIAERIVQSIALN